jgi:UDP-N-acetylglucosamine 3-dehydrogenase
MKSKIRVGILGHGFIGSLHREVLSKLENFLVVSVADPAKDSVEGLPNNVQIFDDYRRVLDNAKDLDAVINALPTANHLQSASDTADCDLPMLLEKPMGTNLEEAEAIKRKVEEKGIKLMVGMTGRYHPEFVSAFEIMGQIGEILHLDERVHIGGTPFPSQYLDSQKCGHGVGLTNGVHTMDRFLWFMNDVVASVSVDYLGNNLFNSGVEDNIYGRVLFNNGKTGRFSLRWSPHQETDYVFEAVGSKGIVKVYGFERAVLVKGRSVTEIYRHNLEGDFRERHKPGIEQELKAFAEFLRGEDKTKHVDDCVKAQRIIDHFYK